MSLVLDLLKRMRGRLGMYIGKQSLARLAFFLRGYDFALTEASDRNDPFLPDFRDWIHQRYKTTSLSWEDAIIAHSKGDEDAVDHFWKLLDEFVDQRQLPAAPGISEHFVEAVQKQRSSHGS